MYWNKIVSIIVYGYGKSIHVQVYRIQTVSFAVYLMKTLQMKTNLSNINNFHPFIIYTAFPSESWGKLEPIPANSEERQGTPWVANPLQG